MPSLAYPGAAAGAACMASSPRQGTAGSLFGVNALRSNPRAVQARGLLRPTSMRKESTDYDDWSFHKQHCGDGNCTFPWESLEISGPIPGSVKLPAGLTQDPRFKLTPIKK